jgi:protein SCO1/2
VAAAAAFVIASGGLWAIARLTAPPALAGDVLAPPAPAYNFRLTDHHGQVVALSDLRGKAVALTFLYTRCPDACPLVAELMRSAYEKLGNDASRTAFVAVSVDPRGDTPESVQAFLEVHRVEGVLTYLHGTFAQLRPVWDHYEVGTGAEEAAPTAVAPSRPAPSLTGPAPGKYIVDSQGRIRASVPGKFGHTAVVYVIDPQGRVRASLPANFAPRDLAANLRRLARSMR